MFAKNNFFYLYGKSKYHDSFSYLYSNCGLILLKILVCKYSKSPLSPLLSLVIMMDCDTSTNPRALPDCQMTAARRATMSLTLPPIACQSHRASHTPSHVVSSWVVGTQLAETRSPQDTRCDFLRQHY